MTYKPNGTINKPITEAELQLAATRMRHCNTTLTSASIRTNLACFDDLDIQRFDSNTNYMVNFISRGINRDNAFIQRPSSTLWPDNYNKMAELLSRLDAYLINTEYKEKPIEWMIANSLSSIPKCPRCNEVMQLRYETDCARWNCNRSEACQNLYAPIQRPSFFVEYENVGILRILFCIYYWSACTQIDLLCAQLKIEPQILSGICRKIQAICRTALEHTYPRYRLCNSPDETSVNMPQGQPPDFKPVDLISIKFNGTFVVCAKHPSSNRVRLGTYTPKVSNYSIVELCETWFASGVHIRVCEDKFLDLTKRRSDLKVELVPRLDMATKDGLFDRNSAFGYLICQLTHVFRDFDSTTIQRETLKLILGELEWREAFGPTPYDAFTNIIRHIAKFAESSQYYFEQANQATDQATDGLGFEYIFAEKHFYATREPIDKDGNVVRHYGQPGNSEGPPLPVVTFLCHLCGVRYESYDFSMHIIAHVERKRNEALLIKKKQRMVECKHCFKTFRSEDLKNHLDLFRCDLQMTKYGCRICCIRSPDRDSFLKHMRRNHFEHETPYRCPSCPFASSFQREFFIHFQEEHRHAFTVLCPICSKPFIIREPQNLDNQMMIQASRIFYGHISNHYAIGGVHSCDKCCLSFTSDVELNKHKAKGHNPCEEASEKVKLCPFIVTSEEVDYCVQVLPMELFVANKRPNVPINEMEQEPGSSEQESMRAANDQAQAFASSQGNRPVNSSSSTSEDSGIGRSASEDGRIQVHSNAKRFLDGGSGSLNVSVKTKAVKTAALTSERIMDCMSKLRRSDGFVPNQSVIMLPNGKPAKCVECRYFITADHYVELISCPHCKYKTNCPRASQNHKSTIHAAMDKLKSKNIFNPNEVSNPSTIQLTKDGGLARCADCFEYVTNDHYFESLPCQTLHCNFTTSCLRALELHRVSHRER